MVTRTHTRTGVHARDCSTKYDPDPCERCGHFACWHRLDSALNVGPKCRPEDPSPPFRCCGEGFDGCEDGCPDYKGTLLIDGETVRCG